MTLSRIMHDLQLWIFLQTEEKYFLGIEIRDMDGAANGLSNTGRAVVSLGDINDNPPTFTQAVVSLAIIFLCSQS